MKYTIEAIENAKPGMRWEEIGCHWTLGQAYLYSKEAGNDMPYLFVKSSVALNLS